MKNIFSTIIITVSLIICASAQDKLYTNEFSLKQVTLLDGPFKNAMDLNIHTLLQYDVERLLEPYYTEAGIPTSAERFANWDGLAGHIEGHYLSALAIHYAATGDTVCKTRLDSMIVKLKNCQDANSNGYLGGVPGGDALWSALKTGDFTLYNSGWVPWYNMHKTYAGLRDAWLYGDNDSARVMFLRLCDWGIDEISGLDDTQMQTMLNKEFGGMNEVYADAYQMTGDVKYLNAAKKFTHNTIYNAMVTGTDNLDNLHANTQIPKVIGFERIAEVDPNATTYETASQFFWNRVVYYRSLALGGNSRSEHFPSAASCIDYTTTREGPESCNTYNMLKLTEDLFRTDPQAKYADFYEQALFNHIRSTQHPEHGGYVYFTPARPRHYRVYSAPNMAMWCCVGTGMENHGKYGQFIYTRKGSDSLYINLFIPSKLNWTDKNVEITQYTQFPQNDSSLLIINTSAPTQFNLLIRHPAWVASNTFKVVVNGDTLSQTSESSSFVCINRTWNDGDTVKFALPMRLTYKELPNVPDYLAFMYGPILLGAKTGTEDLDGLVADDSRWGHIANGPLQPLYRAPIIVSHPDSILEKFVRDDDTLKFTAPELFYNQKNYKTIEFEPFSQIHDARYMMYWLNVTREEYEVIIAELEEEERYALLLDSLSVDQVATGEQQPEADHNMTTLNSYSGTHMDEYWRDARDGGYFCYEMATEGITDLTLMVRYWGNEFGARTFDIKIDGVIIATENVTGKWNISDFVNVEYPISDTLLEGKDYITVCFDARPGNMAGGVFYIWLLKYWGTQSDVKHDKIKNSDLKISKNNEEIKLSIQTTDQNSIYKLISQQGILVAAGKLDTGTAIINTTEFQKGLYVLVYKCDKGIFTEKVIIYQ
ncbi:MAG: glycoside hydrolase family 127 protein [Bacteroidales bacterium]|nr:glycoside hydrolase family 127 protein [Bacteroidales bacterium]